MALTPVRRIAISSAPAGAGADPELRTRRRNFAQVPAPACRGLVAGTLVQTHNGMQAIELVGQGTLVLTADHGFCPVRTSLRGYLGGRGKASPVLIRAGTFGNTRDLRLSQDQRILLPDPRDTSSPGLLAEARHLLNGGTVQLSPCAGVEYIQLVFDAPELIHAEGLLVEAATGPKTALRAPRPGLSAAGLRALMPEFFLPDRAPGTIAHAKPAAGQAPTAAVIRLSETPPRKGPYDTRLNAR